VVHLLLLLITCMSLSCAPGSLAQRVDLSREEQKHARSIFFEIDSRNRTIKKTDAWLTKAYASPGIKKLNDIAPASYDDYRSAVVNGEVVIIVHPGYFPFFDQWSVPVIETDYAKGYPKRNLVERLGDTLDPANTPYLLLREQEKLTRDLIEYLSLEQRLVILILPRNYQDHLTYGYRRGFDEYARYISELTNHSSYILFLESDTYRSGFLLEKDLDMLAGFMEWIGARSILLGGGFFGKCLSHCYISLRSRYSHEQINVVPEITMPPPNGKTIEQAILLDKAGRLSRRGIWDFFQRTSYRSTNNERFHLKPLTWYRYPTIAR